MSSFFKIPQTPLTVIGPSSVPVGSVFGTNFSILQTGGYMEVYSLSDLSYVIPTGTTGPIQYSANTIPIQFTKGTGSVFSFDSITLNSDNISSGRRKLGMLVYVYETNKIYQHSINNYDTLWNNATGSTGVGGATVVISNYGTVVKGNSAAGNSLISAWTASTIEGVDGYTSSDATWRILNLSQTGQTISGGSFNHDTGILTLSGSGSPIQITGFTDIYTTGGSYNSFTSVLSLFDSTGGTVTIPGISAGGGGSTITGGTFDSNTGTLTLSSSGGSIFVTGFTSTFTGGTVTGSTIFTNGLTANTISATTYVNLPIDIRVTGGTYSNGITTFTNNTGGTFTVSGYYTGATDIRVTGGTYSNGSATFTNNTGGTFNVTGFTTPFTGGTVTGSTNFTGGLTSNSISATTYFNTPDTYITGMTFNEANYDLTIFRNDGVSFTDSLAILSSDFTVTGGTYDPNTGTATFVNNTGGTFNITGFMTGFTDIYVTGATYVTNNATSTLTLKRNDNNNITITGFTDVRLTGSTYNPSNGTLSLFNNSGSTITATGFTDYYVTGGTYNQSTNSLTLRRNDNVSVIVTGFTASVNSLTGGTYNITTGIITFTNTTGGTSTITGFNYVTGGTYNSGTSTLTFTTNTGQTISITGLTTSSGAFTGGTVTGPTNFISGITTNTISATTYNNLPISGLTQGTNITITNDGTGNFTISSSAGGSTFTGGTISGPTTFTSGLTANTISATTITSTRFIGNITGSSAQLLLSAATANAEYFPILSSAATGNQVIFTDLGIRYNPSFDRLTINNVYTNSFISTGGTFIVTGNTIVSGITTLIGDTAISGNTNMGQTITASVFVAPNNRIVESNSGGTVSATKVIIDAYITSGGTVANLLENTNNWSPSGSYTGSTITGTFQGQKHYSPTYFFEAVQDNLFIRLQRV